MDLHICFWTWTTLAMYLFAGFTIAMATADRNVSQGRRPIGAIGYCALITAGAPLFLIFYTQVLLGRLIYRRQS